MPPLTPAPLHADLAGGPERGKAWFAQTEDGVALRLVHWAPEGAARGSVLLFPGRTEYAEKWGLTARAFADAGLASLFVDWRGQGLSGPARGRDAPGHVGDFAEYQRDVRTMLATAGALGLPRPWYSLAHSMGGAIALRSLLEGLEMRAAAFSAPMWGLTVARHLLVLAETLATLGQPLGLDRRRVPGRYRVSYVNEVPFGANLLTSDEAMYARLRDHVARAPELGLGPPSLAWTRAALREIRALAPRPAPALPALAVLGSMERVVCPGAIGARIARWGGAQMHVFEGARHEVLIDTPQTRTTALARIIGFFEQAV